MDYFNAFWTGGLICALVQILLDRTKAYARTDHGTSGMYRLCFKRCRNLSAICRICRSRRFCSSAWILANILWKGMKESIDQKRTDRTLYGRLYRLRGGSLRSFDLLLSCKPDLQAQNERITYHE